MKKMRLTAWVLSIATAFLINACNNELTTIESWKDVPVIYGFLSIDDTATYMRVEKAFVDPDKSGPEVAQIADSLYYTDATVTLYRVRTPAERFELTRVNGATEGYPRKSGTFAATPNILYKIKTSRLNLKTGEEWVIEVQRKGETKPIAKATTKVVGNFDIVFPDNNPLRPLSLSYDRAFNVRIESETEKTARIFDVNIIVNYDETESGKPTVRRQVIWSFAPGSVRKVPNSGNPDPIVSFSRIGRDFSEFMRANVPIIPGVVRNFKGIDVELLSGGQELIDYLTVGQANIGITGSQTIPTFTNVTGGLGIFTSRSRVLKTGILLDFDGLDLLKTGALTRELNFR
jgi:hypothetical protein